MPIETDAGVSNTTPDYVSIFDALDNLESRLNFMKMLGFEPIYNDKGNIVAWEEVKVPEYKEVLMALLSLMSSKKSMGIAVIEDVEALTEMEVEIKTEIALELAELLASPDTDTLPYLPAIEWAKLEMKKGLTLAKDGLLVKAVAGVPFLPASEATPTITQPEKKSFWDRLFGRG